MNDKVIETKGLTKRFGSFTAVDHISFEVGRGEIFGFLGANGAGKTTAMRMLCGPEPPDRGRRYGRRVRHRAPKRADQTQHRLHEPALFAVRRPESVGKHPAVRRHLRHGKPADRRKDRPGAAPARIRRRTQHAGKRAAARLEAETGFLGSDLPRAAHRLPRRADRRGRSGYAAAVLGAEYDASDGASRFSSRRTTWTRRSTATASRSWSTGRSGRWILRPT